MTSDHVDGAEILSRISGLAKDEIKRQWELAKENNAKLRSCPRHRIEGPPPPLGKNVTCTACGGAMRLHIIGAYIDGYRAMGGDPADIWPEYAQNHLQPPG